MATDQDPIPLFKISWDQSEIMNAIDSIGRGGYWAKGPYVDKFETGLEDYLGVEHAIVVNSGTTALVTALRSLGVGEGDEVIVPSMTFVATANAVRLVGAKPVFADIETESYGLDPASVGASISADTEAIIPVHLYGGPCRINEITQVASNHDIAIIEDAAEAFGAAYEGEYLGTIGEVGTLSFCQNKVLTTGEGGAIVTDDEEVAQQARLYRSHGRKEGDYFDQAGSGEYSSVGTNIRMSDLTAAIGCAQLERIDELIAGRRRVAAQLSEALNSVPGISTPTTLSGGNHVYQLYTVEFDPEIDRNAVINMLASEDIDSKVYWDTPVHQTKAYQNHPASDVKLPVTESVAESILSLPMYPELSRNSVDRISKVVKERLSESR